MTTQLSLEEKTWEEILKDETGTVYKDEYDEGVRIIILKGPASLCIYFGFPISHPLSGFDYEDIPVRVHGGFTYAREGDDNCLPKGYWWYGADYAHSDDYCFYYDQSPIKEMLHVHENEKKWLVEDVYNDCWSTIYDIKSLVKLSEKIHNKK